MLIRKMNYLNTLKRIYRVIPKKFQKNISFFLFLSILNLLIEIFSIALLFPIVLILINKELDQTKQIFKLINFNYSDFGYDNQIIFVTLVIVLFILKNYISINIIKYQSKTAYEISVDISSNMTEVYLHNDYLNYKKEKKSSIIRNVISIPNEFSNFVLLSLNIIFSEILLLTLILIACIIINTKMTLFLMGITFFSLFILYKINKKGTKEIRKYIAKNYSENISNLMNILNGFFEIKSSNKESFFQKKFFESNRSLNKKYAYLNSKRISQPKYVEITLIIILCALFILFNNFSKNQTVDVIFLSLLIASAIKIVPSINKISTAMLNLNSYLYTIDIIEEKCQNQNNKKPVKDIFDFKKLAFKNLSFSYDEKKILNNINFNIKKGDIIGIYGDSGSGKTTFLNILTQLTSSYEGAIFVDDILIEKGISYKKLISYMPQEPFILDDTILNNITLGVKDYNLEQINLLSRDLNLDTTIKALPEKLNAYIGNDGHNLSGGQKQRLALIRTILSNPKILILDEATNQLDEKTELEVFIFLKNMIKKNISSIIIVSHNLKNMKLICNKIFKLKDRTLSIYNEV